MKKVLLMIVTALMSCGNNNQKSEKVLSKGEQSAIAYVSATISSMVKVDSVIISDTDTLLCADMPEIDDSLHQLMCKNFGTGKISEKEFRDFLGKRSDALMAISKTWKFSRIKTDNAKYLIDEIRLDKRWEPYWRTVYTVKIFTKGYGHEYRVMMDSTCTKAITTEEDFRNMMNKKEDGIFDIFD
jgi:hypothetical protein